MEQMFVNVLMLAIIKCMQFRSRFRFNGFCAAFNVCVLKLNDFYLLLQSLLTNKIFVS